MLTGELPFYNTNREALFNSILRADYAIRSFFSPDVCSLLRSLLIPEVLFI